MTKRIIVKSNIKGEYEILQPKFRILFKCATCGEIVEPDIILLGKAHIYMCHCDTMQDVGIVTEKIYKEIGDSDE